MKASEIKQILIENSVLSESELAGNRFSNVVRDACSVDYSKYVIHDGEFDLMVPPGPIVCRLMSVCKCGHGCSKAHLSRKKVGILRDVPSTDLDDENDLESSELAQVHTSCDLPLPRSGDRKATCGHLVVTGGCLEHHTPLALPEGVVYQRNLDGKCLSGGAYVEWHRDCCHRLVCPVCGDKTVDREVSRSQKRFQVYDDVPANYRRAGRYMHGFISIPEPMHGLPLKKLRAEASKWAQYVGVEGCCMVFHPYRKSKRKGMYFSPHFHFVGYGWIDGKKVAEMNAKTGIIIKNAGLRKIGNKESLAATLRYEFGHMGVPKDHAHALVWYGTLAYNKLHVPKVPAVKRTCPWGHELRPIAYVGKEKLTLPLLSLDEDLTVESYTAYLPREFWTYVPRWAVKDG